MNTNRRIVMKFAKFAAIAAMVAFTMIGSAQAYTSIIKSKGTIRDNNGAQLLCQFWVNKVEKNSSIMQGWLVRRTVGLSGDKYGGANSPYAKIFQHSEGDGYRELLVNLSWELRGANYAIARNPNIHFERKAALCEKNGGDANSVIFRFWRHLNPGGKIK